MRRHRTTSEFASADALKTEHWQSLLQAVLDSTEDGVLVVASDGHILAHNRRFIEICGIADGQLAGQTEDAVLRTLQRQLLVPPLGDDGDYGKIEQPGVEIMPFTDGRIIERIVRPFVVANQVVGRIWTFRDASRYRQTVAALRESEHRYRLLFEASQSASYVTSLDGRFVDVNPAAEELFGYTRAELLELSARSLYADPDDRDLFRDAISENGTIRDFEVNLQRKDGAVLHCLLSAAVHRDSNGLVIGYQGIIQDITELKRREASLMHEAQHDPLTELPHRRFFAAKLDRAIDRRRLQTHYRFSLLFIDLDDFKSINDTHGHAIGDQLLVAVARRLERLVRPEDTVARIGGDEFAILLYHVKDAEEAAGIAERVRAGLAHPYNFKDITIHSTASVGVALWTRHHNNATDFLAEADAAMYRAKQAGANRIEFYPTPV